jgi:hypothetical protein
LSVGDGFADGLAYDACGFVHGNVALAVEFLDGTGGKVAGDEASGGVVGDVFSGDPGHGGVGGHCAGQGAGSAERRQAEEKILHEIGGTQVQDVEAGDAVELLFLIMQADDGAGAVCVLRADAAEVDGEGHTSLKDCGGEEIGDAVLMGAQVGLREVFGENEIGCVRAC